MKDGAAMDSPGSIRDARPARIFCSSVLLALNSRAIPAFSSSHSDSKQLHYSGIVGYSLRAELLAEFLDTSPGLTKAADGFRREDLTASDEAMMPHMGQRVHQMEVWDRLALRWERGDRKREPMKKHLRVFRGDSNGGNR